MSSAPTASISAPTAEDGPICDPIRRNGHRRCAVMVRNGGRHNLFKLNISDDEGSRQQVARLWAQTLGKPDKEGEFLERVTSKMAAIDWDRVPLPPPEKPAAQLALVENDLHVAEPSPAPKRKNRKRRFEEVESARLPDGHPL